MKKKAKIIPATVTAMTVFLIQSFIIAAAAESGNDSGINNAMEVAGPLLNDIITIICFIFAFVGAVMAVIGFIQLVLSFTDQSGESKKTAITFLIVGIVLLFMRQMIKNLDIVSYVSDSYGGSKTQSESQVDEMPQKAN